MVSLMPSTNRVNAGQLDALQHACENRLELRDDEDHQDHQNDHVATISTATG